MSMTAMVNDIASQGRNGDTILAHISKEEAELLKDRGGSGTINPETGIMEFNIFSDLWDGFKSVVKTVAPIIIPAVAIFVPTLIPAIGAYLGASAATAGIVGAAALSAGVTLAAGGDLKQVLTSAALAGASTYLTPIVGKALTFDGASQLSQIMAGSAAVGAGYTAMRGGGVKEMMASAATGAASAYLGSLAKDAVSKMNNLMASGKVTGTITEKGATDATFAAADAANLKAAGLTQAEISKTLQATGVNPAAADYAAASVVKGIDTSTIAANMGAASTSQQIYSGAANTHAMIAGNNAEMLQRVEDAKLLATDAAQLKAQGLSQNDIKENLLASGVDANTAASVAYQASQGQSADTMSTNMINGSTYLTSGKVYTGTDTIARDLGQAMDAQQMKEYKALPFKDMINNGQMTIDEAAVLGQHGVSAQQATDLAKLGYTPSDLDNLIGSGVTPQTLTTLAATKFPESDINHMLQNGVSANDISNASIQVTAGKVSTTVAENLLNKGLSGQEVVGLAINNKADTVSSLMDKGLTEDNFRKMYQSGTDFAKVDAGLNSGKLSMDTLNSNVATNNSYNNWINQQLAVTPTAPTTGTPTPNLPTPLSTQIANTGLVNAVDAQILAQGNYSPTDVKNLVALGYTGSDLADMAATGITAQTLTTLAATPFPEATINDLLTSGHSANEISKASFAVSSKGVPLDTATQLMEKGVNGSDIYNMSFAKAGTVDQALQLANRGVDAATISKLYTNSWDMNKIAAGIDDGHLTADGLNKTVATNSTGWGVDINKQLAAPVAAKPVEPPATTTTQTTQPAQPTSPVTQTTTGGTVGGVPATTTVAQTPVEPTPTPAPVETITPAPSPNPVTAGPSDLAVSIAGSNADASAVQSFLDKGYSVQQISNAIDSHPNGGWGGQLIAEAPGAQPVLPNPTATAELSPTNQKIATDAGNDYLAGKITWDDASAKINGAVQNDINSGYLKANGDGSYTAPDGTEYFFNNDTGMWDSSVGVDKGQGAGPGTTPEVPSNVATTPSQPVTPETPNVTPPATTTETPTQPVQPAPEVTTPTTTGPSVPDVTGQGTTQTTNPTVDNTGGTVSGGTGTGGTSGSGTGIIGGGTGIGNGTNVPGTGPVVPDTTTPLSPPTQVEIPAGTSTVTPVTPGTDATEIPHHDAPPEDTTDTTVDPNPYIPIPTDPTTPTDTTHYGTYKLGPIPYIRPTEGLNPGWITNVPQQYQPTSQAGAQYYWGQHPYQPGSTFDRTLYNQSPNAPVSPFGSTYAKTSATPQQILNAMGSYYPLIGSVNTPVKP